MLLPFAYSKTLQNSCHELSILNSIIRERNCNVQPANVKNRKMETKWKSKPNKTLFIAENKIYTDQTKRHFKRINEVFATVQFPLSMSCFYPPERSCIVSNAASFAFISLADTRDVIILLRSNDKRFCHVKNRRTFICDAIATCILFLYFREN